MNDLEKAKLQKLFEDCSQLCSPIALHGLKPPVPEDVEALFGLLIVFYSFSTPEIKSASELATTLADKTKFSQHILKGGSREER